MKSMIEKYLKESQYELRWQKQQDDGFNGSVSVTGFCDDKKKSACESYSWFL